jgi:hypothetical protein
MYCLKGLIFSAILLGGMMAIPSSVNAAPEITQPKDDVALSVRFGGGYGPSWGGHRYYRRSPYRGYNRSYRYYRSYPYGGYYYRGARPYYWYGSRGGVYFRF